MWLRRLVIVVCAVIPVLVAYARLYRGMHHLSDVLIGALNGIACALLAWTCLRTPRRNEAATRHLAALTPAGETPRGQVGWRRVRSHSRASRKSASSVPRRTATEVPSARG